MKKFYKSSLKNEVEVSRCYTRIVNCLLKYGSNIEEQLSKTDFNKLLHIAVEKQLQSVVKILIKNGADIYFQDDFGNTALTLAKKNNDNQIYYSLIHTEIDFKITKKKDSTSFLKINVIVLLLESFYVNYFPTLYYTHQLICENPIYIALLLINSNTIIKYFFIDVYEAIKNGYKDIVNIILSNGVDINVRDKFGRLMLQCACYEGNKSAVQFLFSMGANVNKLDAYQRSPLYVAVAAQQIEIVELLIKQGANIHVHKCGRNLLYNAINSQQTKGLDIVKILIKKGLNINNSLKTNQPLLHHAVEEGCIKILEFLLNNGADINNQNMQGETPLHISVKTLNKNGDYNINIQQYYDLFTLYLIKKPSWSLRWHKRMNEKSKIVWLLFKYNADVNATDSQGETSLTINNIGTIGIILLTKHLAKLSVLNMQINGRNLEFINKNEKLKIFFSKCKEELILMKNQFIYGSISFFNILCETNVNILATYAKNKLANQKIYNQMINSEYGKAKFPIYDHELKVQLAEGKERRTLLDLATIHLNNCFHYQIPNSITEKIILYLHYEDWISLAKC